MTFLCPSRPSWLRPVPFPTQISNSAPAASTLSRTERLRRLTWDHRYQQLAELVADPSRVDVTADERLIDRSLAKTIGLDRSYRLPGLLFLIGKRETTAKTLHSDFKWKLTIS